MPPAPATPAEPTSAEKVVIGCKLPHGLQVNARAAAQPEAGKNATPAHAPIKNTLYLNGANDDSAKQAGGFGLTLVDKTDADAFMSTHGDAEYIKNNLVFVEKNIPSAQARGRELSGEKTGFEGVDPAKPDPKLTQDTSRDATKET